MRYRINIRVEQNKKYTFLIDAKDEAQALERLKLRLPPHQREDLIMDTISIDPTSLAQDDPYGSFGGE